MTGALKACTGCNVAVALAGVLGVNLEGTVRPRQFRGRRGKGERYSTYT